MALRGAAAYQLSWFGAYIWGYAEHFGLAEILSKTSSTTVSTAAFAPSIPFSELGCSAVALRRHAPPTTLSRSVLPVPRGRF